MGLLNILHDHETTREDLFGGSLSKSVFSRNRQLRLLLFFLGSRKEHIVKN